MSIAPVLQSRMRTLLALLAISLCVAAGIYGISLVPAMAEPSPRLTVPVDGTTTYDGETIYVFDDMSKWKWDDVQSHSATEYETATGFTYDENQVAALKSYWITECLGCTNSSTWALRTGDTSILFSDFGAGLPTGFTIPWGKPDHEVDWNFGSGEAHEHPFLNFNGGTLIDASDIDVFLDHVSHCNDGLSRDDAIAALAALINIMEVSPLINGNLHRFNGGSKEDPDWFGGDPYPDPPSALDVFNPLINGFNDYFGSYPTYDEIQGLLDDLGATMDETLCTNPSEGSQCGVDNGDYQWEWVNMYDGGSSIPANCNAAGDVCHDFDGDNLFGYGDGLIAMILAQICQGGQLDGDTQNEVLIEIVECMNGDDEECDKLVPLMMGLGDDPDADLRELLKEYSECLDCDGNAAGGWNAGGPSVDLQLPSGFPDCGSGNPFNALLNNLVFEAFLEEVAGCNGTTVLFPGDIIDLAVAFSVQLATDPACGPDEDPCLIAGAFANAGMNMMHGRDMTFSEAKEVMTGFIDGAATYNYTANCGCTTDPFPINTELPQPITGEVWWSIDPPPPGITGGCDWDYSLNGSVGFEDLILLSALYEKCYQDGTTPTPGGFSDGAKAQIAGWFFETALDDCIAAHRQYECDKSRQALSEGMGMDLSSFSDEHLDTLDDLMACGDSGDTPPPPDSTMEAEAGEADDDGDEITACDDDPTRTANPVDVTYGHKQESAIDLTVRLPGGDFAIRRSYSSKHDLYNATTMPAGGLVGFNWWLDCFGFLDEDPLDSDRLRSFSPDTGVVSYYAHPTISNRFDAIAGSMAHIEVDAANDVATLIIPGSHEVEYHWNSSEPNIDGLPKVYRDIYGNERTFDYAQVRDTDDTDQYWRLSSIWLNGTDNTDAKAEVRFTWAEGQGGPNDDDLGWVTRIEVYRGDLDVEPIKTQVVEYTYHDGDLDAQLGSFGDLLQVRHRVKVDASVDFGIPWHDTFTQYRYHNESINESTTVDDDGDGFYEIGQNHQLKSVILPQQIEYAHQQRSRFYNLLRPVKNTADALLEMTDGDTVFTDNSGGAYAVYDLASKVVEQYESSSPHRVTRQYLKSACGCSGGGSYGQRLDYEYQDEATSGDYKTTKIVEYALDDNGAFQFHKARYYDLYEYTVESLDYFRVVNIAIADTESHSAATRYWVTHHDYDATLNVEKAYTASAMSSYVPAESATTIGVPEYTAKTTGGLVYKYEYLNDTDDTDGHNKRPTATLVRSENGSSWYYLSTIEYGDPTVNSSERWHLPKRLSRFRSESTTTSVSADDVEVTKLEYDYLTVGKDDVFVVTTITESETVAELGPGGQDWYTSYIVYNEHGDVEWVKAADDTLVRTTYDQATGATTSIVANSDGAGMESSISSILGSDTRSADGGEHATQIAVDLLGRTESVEASNGNTTHYLRQVRSAYSRPGSPYLARVMLPQVVSNSGGGFEGSLSPATIQTIDARGVVFESLDYSLTASGTDHEFDLLIDGGYLYTLDAVAARVRLNHDLSGLLVSADVFHRADRIHSAMARYRTQFQYDSLGRLSVEVNPNGTMTRTSFDLLDRPRQIQIGTTESNLVPIIDLYYDGDYTAGADKVGNSNITEMVEYPNSTSGDDRVYKYAYDWRDRLMIIENPMAPHAMFDYDNLSRRVKEAVFSSVPTDINSTTDRGSFDEYFYSQRGLLYSATTQLDPTSASADHLASYLWYDEVGRVVGAWGPNAPGVKLDYDGLGRLKHRYLTDRSGDTAYGDVFDQASPRGSDLSSDTVLSQTDYEYINSAGNGAHGLLSEVVSWQRTHNSTATGAASVNAANWIRSYVGMHYDDYGRQTHTVNYGTGTAGTTDPIFKDGVDPDHDESSPPDASVTPFVQRDALISMVQYNNIGLPHITTNAIDQESLIVYDDMYRRVAVEENVDLNGETYDDILAEIIYSMAQGRWMIDPAHDTGSHWKQSDRNRITFMTYDGLGNVRQQIARNYVDGDTVGTDQITTYIYETLTSNGSDIDSYDLLSEIVYPDNTDPDTNTDDVVTYAYNRLGELISTTDQNGTVHDFDRDDFGRVTEDAVTLASGSPIDDFIDKITVSYDGLGRAEYVRSYDGSTVINAVQFGYTAAGVSDFVKQTFRGDIVTGSPQIDYDFAESAATGAYATSTSNYLRPESQTYDYRAMEVGYSYDEPGGSAGLDDHISRLRSISASSLSDDIEYYWIGGGMLAEVEYTEPAFKLTRWATKGGAHTNGEYAGYDSFGRIINQRWVDSDFDEHATPSADYAAIPPINDLAYDYDNISRVLSRTDERPGANWPERDYEFQYDELNRLTKASRGAQGASFVVGDRSQEWAYDLVGNKTSYGTDLDGDDSFDDKDETIEGDFNLANEIEELTGNDGVVDIPLPFSYDEAGNMTEQRIYDQAAGTADYEWHYVHDAWNRLVEVAHHDVSASTTLNRARYEFNGLHWRTIKESDLSSGGIGEVAGDYDERRMMLYNAAWQLVEERIDEDFPLDSTYAAESSDIDRVTQYIWGIRGMDDCIVHQTDDAPNWNGFNGPWKFFYHVTDLNFSTIAILDETGELLERIEYDAYGLARHHWAGDVDGDGSNVQWDKRQISKLTTYSIGSISIGGASYDPDADLDRNGVIDTTDYNLAVAVGTQIALPLGELSIGAVDNIVGFAAYLFNAETGDYLVRYRVYDPETGRWLERDPSGYADGPSLYVYGVSRPVSGRDGMGLDWKHEYRRHGKGGRIYHHLYDSSGKYVRSVYTDIRRLTKEEMLVLLEGGDQAVDLLAELLFGVVASDGSTARFRSILSDFSEAAETTAYATELGVEIAGFAIITLIPGPEDLVLVALANGVKYVRKGAQWYRVNRTREVCKDGKIVEEIVEEELELVVDGLTAGSDAEKAAAWIRYKERGGDWGWDKWSKSYDTLQVNRRVGGEAEIFYRGHYGGRSRVVTAGGLGRRQIDVYYEVGKQIYAVEIKTGRVTAKEFIRKQIEKDAYLVARGVDVTWILEEGASDAVLELLKDAGITVIQGGVRLVD